MPLFDINHFIDLIYKRVINTLTVKSLFKKKTQNECQQLFFNKVIQM